MIFSDGNIAISDESAVELARFARLIGLKPGGSRLIVPENAVRRAGNRGAVFVPSAALERIHELVVALRKAPVAYGGDWRQAASAGLRAQIAVRVERERGER